MEILTRQPLDLAAMVSAVAAPGRGGVATFLGLVRDHHAGRSVRALSYSAYEPMAEAVCREITGEAESRWDVKVAIAHRLGGLAIGDAAVAIAAAAAHRDEAFAACRYAIEELKRRVPIWKQETYSDGSVEWVDPTAGNVEAEPGSRKSQ